MGSKERHFTTKEMILIILIGLAAKKEATEQSG
jgi:hypothetical protein